VTKLEYHITNSITKKFAAEKALPSLGTEPPHIERPRCFGPGSDILDSDPKLHITTLNNSHLLVIGKFCVNGPHLLLLTTDSYRRQHKPLDADDLEAAYSVIIALEPERQHFAFYNCGRDAGSSRDHKHVQVLLRPGPMFPDNPEFDRSTIPYVYFLRYLDGLDNPWNGGGSTGDQLKVIYDELLGQARAALNLPHDQDCPHNMMLVKGWMIVIPRRSNDFYGVTANAAGMMGYVWLGTHEQLENWKKVGPIKALVGLGVPASTHQSTPA
jgi:ATP adenylyltransferase/5',5'''-P-1,P-4-tetraphosphate phosphorylase II